MWGGVLRVACSGECGSSSDYLDINERGGDSSDVSSTKHMMTIVVSGLLTVALSFHTAPRAPRAHAVRLRSGPVTMIKELDKKTWCQHVDGAENLAVVFFFATWCRSCRAVGPVYKRIAKEYPAADFYRVNFKAESELCYQQRVLCVQDSYPSTWERGPVMDGALHAAEHGVLVSRPASSFPVVHFYLPGIGRVGRLVLAQ